MNQWQAQALLNEFARAVRRADGLQWLPGTNVTERQAAVTQRDRLQHQLELLLQRVDPE